MTGKSTINPSLQKSYLPKEVKDLYIGIPKAAAVKLHKTIPVTDRSYMVYPDEIIKSGDVKKISYRLNEDNTICEFIIEYHKEDKAIAVAKQLYNEVNDPATDFKYSWKFTLKDGLKLKCWVYENKICIADSRAIVV